VRFELINYSHFLGGGGGGGGGGGLHSLDIIVTARKICQYEILALTENSL